MEQSLSNQREKNVFVYHFMKGFLPGDIIAFHVKKLELFCSGECHFPVSALLIECQDSTQLQNNF